MLASHASKLSIGKPMSPTQRGFTLIEIAIVLVIIGLLLGGVLKGQELITSARVRNLISQQDGVKAAYFGFLDRYRSLPGDYASASTNIKAVTTNGDGDGQIELSNSASVNESILAWDHLSHAGFVTGSYTYSATQSENTTPKNPYGAYLQLVYDGVYGAGTTATPSASRHNLKSGNQIPVTIAVEIDRKVDDGNPYNGNFQFSEYLSADRTNCVDSTGTPAWKISTEAGNCGGASLF